MSKELDSLENIKIAECSVCMGSHCSECRFNNDYKIIQKGLRALNLIKVHKIEGWRVINSDNYQDYIENYCFSKLEQITEEEYNLLREILA